MDNTERQELLDHIHYLKTLLIQEENRNNVNNIRVSVAVGLINEVLVLLSAARNSPYQSINVTEFDQLDWKDRALDIVKKLSS